MSKRYVFGEWWDGNQPLSTEDAARICEMAEESRKEFSRYPRDKVFRVLEKLRQAWRDPALEERRQAEAVLPEITGFSLEMVKLGLAELDFILDPAMLRKKLETELREIPIGMGYRYRYETKTALQWSPLGTVLHVLSGNVFLVGVGSFIEGLVTGNVSILKMSSNEKFFLPLFLSTLQACDEEGVVSRSVAAIDYSSSQKDVMSELKRRVDAIAVWGGEDAVRSYRNDVPARTRIIVFGPKLSIGVVTREGMRRQGASKVAQACAEQVSIWDQNACTAPQLCFVEGEENVAALVNALPAALEKVLGEFPPGGIPVSNAVEIQKLRSISEIAEARGEGYLRTSPKGVDWTVLGELPREEGLPPIEPGPLHRTIRVVAYRDVKEVVSEAEKLRGYLQTVGLVASEVEALELGSAFSKVGAQRILPLRAMAGGEIDDPHDGAYDLPHFLNLVVMRAEEDPIDYLSSSARGELLDSRLRDLLAHARARSSHYGTILKGIEVRGVPDLPRVPPLTRSLLDANMPPRGRGLAANEAIGGYVTRSGGSTGEPKFSHYDQRDWEEMVEHAVRSLRATGIQKGDRLANFMLAGDLYGSFVSFDHVVHRIGATVFPFAGKAEPEVVARVFKSFAVNVVLGIPGALLPVLRQAKERDPSLTIEKVVYAGMPMSRADATWLRESLGVKRIGSMIGANDGGGIAFQCDKMDGTLLHHVMDEYNLIEIVDESGAPVPDGEPGRILITSLMKYAYPLIRYEIGDRGRIVPGLCECGRTTRRFEFLGRADDVICIGMLNIQVSDLKRAIERYPVSALQVVGSSIEKWDQLELRIESDSHASLGAQEIRSSVLEQVKIVQAAVNDGKMGLEVSLCAPGSLPRNPRTGKIPLIVDQRLSS